jgi:hypothetical protein
MSPPKRGPVLRRTRWSDLAVPLVIVGISVYVLLKSSYDQLPPLGYALPVPIGMLAVAEFVAARRVRMAIRHDPNAKPMAAIVIARCLALGKASSLVGAGVVGAASALLGRVLPEAGTVDAAAHDTRVGALILGVALLLTGAGLLLERAALDPGNGRDPRDRGV